MDLQGVVSRLTRFLPSRYSGHSRAGRAWKAVRMAHLPSFVALLLLLASVLFVRSDRHGLTLLQDDASRHYLALLPTPPHALATDQVWHALRQVVSSALLQQNVTHNGTLKGVVSLRQFRSRLDSTEPFFPNCDFHLLDREDREAPAHASRTSGWRYSAVGLTSSSAGRWCTYPPEGYNTYLGDLSVGLSPVTLTSHRSGSSSKTPPQTTGQAGHKEKTDTTTRHKDRQETTAAKSNVKKTGIGRPSTDTVAREGLHSLDELESHAWIDGNTRAVLLTVAVVEPGTATAATITIIFEHFGGSRRTAEGGGETWWVSHSTSSVDLKYNVKKLVLLITFLVVHIFVVIHELQISVVDVSVAYVMRALGEVVQRCASRATVLNLVILALHICLVLFSYRISAASRHEFNKLAVAFKLAFSPDVVRNDTLLYDIYYHERLGHWHLTGGIQSQPGFGRSNSHSVQDTAPGKDHFGHGPQGGEEGRQHFFGEGNGTIAGDRGGTDFFGEGNGTIAGDGGGTDFFGEGHGSHGGDEDGTDVEGNFLSGVEDKLDLGDGGSFFSSNETLELFPVEKRKSRPQSSWLPEYYTQVLRVRFGQIIHWNDLCIVLLTVEVLLYLTKLSVFEDYCGAALRTVMKTLQLGSLDVLVTLALLLSLLTAAAYVIHTHDGGEDGRNCFTFLTLLKATLSYCLSLDDSWSDGCGSPSRLLETLGVVMVLAGAISAIVVFRVVVSRQEGVSSFSLPRSVTSLMANPSKP